MKIHCRLAGLALATALAASAAAAAPAVPITEARIDDTVARAMAAFQAPGVAVGIVKDGKVVMAKGYGVRQAGKPDRVDAGTVFQIGSNTKAFTTAALSILVDEGKISWDGRVIDYLPDFRMYDPYVTREFTIRDLVTHRSGLGAGAGDLMFYPATDFSRAEIIHGLRYLKPRSSFRSRYDYDNVLYIVAGEIVPAVTGQTWEDFVQTRILTPLGMKGCAPNYRRVAPRTNLASPHQALDGKPAAIPVEDLEIVGAAGTINCNVLGMNAWLLTQLAAGRSPSGSQIFSAARSDDLWSPVTPERTTPALAALTGSNFKAYGLGWELSDQFGYKRVSHTGVVPGMTTWVAMIPQLKLGVVVLTNNEGGLAMQAIGNQILDAYIGAPRRDWVDTLERVAQGRQADAQAVDQKLAAALASADPPPLSLEAYAGRYVDPWRGEATVRRDGDHLVLKISRTQDLEGALAPLSGGIFVVRWNRRGLQADAYVRFTPKFGGGVEGMTLQP
ncbi:MAG: serine hydrolase, partial [Phenylobacterium sp.]